MKITRLGLCLIFFLLLCMPPVGAQQSDQKVSVNLTNASLEDVFKAIEGQTTYRFAYRDEVLNAQKNITVDMSDQSVDAVLDQVLSGRNLQYSIVSSRSIVISDQRDVARSRVLRGTVLDSGGQPMIGVNVVVKGTTTGTATDAKGNYQVTTDVANPVLVFSYLGYTPKEVAFGTGTEQNVVMESGAVEIETTVVTALGIKREEKALSYNVQTVAGDELQTVKSGNFMNSLAGKVAGVQINAAAGPGGGVKVVARGNKSLMGGNNVLYVIDGVPMRNNSPKVDEAAATMSSQQGSEAIADINPDDIESLTMLTGPAAAALYGYEGANGVILITTKKGISDKTRITVSNNTTFSDPLMLPEFQDRYGNVDGSSESWGDRTNRRFDPAKFYQTGHNVSTGVSIQTGVGKHQMFFSAANTSAAGIIPNNKYNRNNFSARYTTSFLNDKLTLDVSANYIIQKDKNGVSQGSYFNPLPALYLFPRGESFDEVRNYQYYDIERQIMMQYWPYGDMGINAQNPYWIQNKMDRENSKERYMYTASLKYDITSWLNIVGRVNRDVTDYKNENKWYAGTSAIFANENKGAYKLTLKNEKQTYADLILNMNRNFGEFSVFVNLGGSIKDYRWNENIADGRLSSAGPPNWFEVEAIDRDNIKQITNGYHHQIESVFFNAEVGWKGMLYLTLTGRNDWDSSLAYSGHSKNSDVSFFYPSVGLSVLFNQMFNMPRGFDFAKLRFARTEVGNGIVAHRAYAQPYYNYNDQTHQWTMDTQLGYDNPKNEKTVSYEVGADLRFLGGALTLDATGYISNTYNQTYIKEISGGLKKYAQAGNVRNAGIELTLGYNKTWSNGLGWRTAVTYSYNKNTVVGMKFNVESDKGNYTQMASFGDATQVRITKGGSMRDLYVRKYNWILEDHGELYINPNTGAPMLEPTSSDMIDGWEKVGSMDAHSYANWSNTISYKGFDLGIQFRGRFGGYVVSNTQAIMDRYGVSKYSADLRDAGGVMLYGTRVSAENYLKAITDGNGRGKYYIYDATNVRLGEMSLSYNLPRKWFNDVVGISVGVVANNVALLFCKAPFDPEQATSAGDTYYNGVDYFMTPSTRTIGFNVKLQF